MYQQPVFLKGKHMAVSKKSTTTKKPAKAVAKTAKKAAKGKAKK